MLTEQQIAALPDPADRIWHRCIQALHGRATITATVTHRGGGSIPRTSEYTATAIGPDILSEVTVKDSVEWRLQGDLAAKYKKARRVRDIDIFKREVQQRSGRAVSPELAEQWAEELLYTQPYAKYTDLRAKRMSEAVAMFPA